MRVWLLWLFLLCLLACGGGPVSRAEASTSFRDLKISVKVEDSSEPSAATDWVSSGPLVANPSIGYSLTKSLWIRFELFNGSSSVEDRMVVFSERSLCFIDLFVRSPGGNETKAEGGTCRSSKELSGMALPANAFALSLPPGTSVVTAKISGPNPLTGSFFVESVGVYARIERMFILRTGIFFGVLAVLVLFNLYAFLRTRSRLFGYYVSFLCLVFLTCGAVTGILDFIFPFSGDGWAYRLPNFSLSTAFLGLLFTREFLVTERNQKGLHRVSQTLGVLALLPIIPSNTSLYPWSAYAADMLVGLSLLMMFAHGAVAAARRSANGAVFLWSWFPFLLGALLTILLRRGFALDANIPSCDVLFGTLGLTLTLLSFYLAKSFVERDFEILNANRKTSEISFENLERQRLIRVLCHDIANPLQTIVSNTQIALSEKDVSESLRTKLERIAQAGEHLSSIVGLTRRLEAVKSGKLPLQIQPTSFPEVIAELCEAFSTRLSEKHIEVRSEFLDSPEKLVCLADRVVLVHSVLANILSNAIKFSPNGSSIKISLWRDSSVVCCAITDCGLGVPSALVSTLFDRVSASTRQGVNGEKGTGFGLPIAHSFAEQMGGSLALKTSHTNSGQESTGATFEVRLPGAV